MDLQEIELLSNWGACAPYQTPRGEKQKHLDQEDAQPIYISRTLKWKFAACPDAFAVKQDVEEARA
eukprot:243676-Pelagomonas_calceolata.AAC.1